MAVAHKSSMRRLNSLKSMKKYTGKNRRASLVSEVMISPSKTGDSDMSSDDSRLEDDDEELVTEDAQSVGWFGAATCCTRGISITRQI